MTNCVSRRYSSHSNIAIANACETKWILPPDQAHGGLLYSYVFTKQGKLRMKISGVGKVPGKYEKQPWLRYRNKITEIVIGEGIIEIGQKAFYGYGWLTELHLPSSLRSIEYAAFASCIRLEKITYYGTYKQYAEILKSPNALPDHFLRTPAHNKQTHHGGFL